MADPNEIVQDVFEALETTEFMPVSSPQPGTPLLAINEQARVRARARRVEALSLRLAGLSYETIGDRLGISEEGARDLVNRTLERAESKVVDQERALENARLDRAQAAIWTKVIEGDLKAVDTYLRISQRRAKMNGLDAPTKIDLSLNVRQEMEQALVQLERVVLGEVIHAVEEPDPAAIES